MAEPTLEAVFGAGAAQTSSTLTISKADLAAVGLVASSSNTAESLLASIVKLAANTLTQAGYDSNLDQSIVVAPGFGGFTSRDDGTGTFVEYLQKQDTVTYSVPDTTGLNVNDL